MDNSMRSRLIRYFVLITVCTVVMFVFSPSAALQVFLIATFSHALTKVIKARR